MERQLDDDGETVALAPSLDSLILEHEKSGKHIDGGVCEFRLGQGLPLSKVRCAMCVRLSTLIDLTSSWSQRIDTGRLLGRSIQVVSIPNARTVRDAEAAWKSYRECDNAQRVARQSLIRRYYASFTCNGSHYTLRDVTHNVTPPLDVMIAQLIELFSTPGAFPLGFVHGNPTVTSISFSARLPVGLKHTILTGDGETQRFSSRYLLQVDHGGVDTAAISAAKRESLGAISVDSERGTLTVRPDASFISFLREYPTHANTIALHSLLRGLLSLYPKSESEEYTSVITQGPSSSASLREVFDELKGTSISTSIIPQLLPLVAHLWAKQ